VFYSLLNSDFSCSELSSGLYCRVKCLVDNHFTRQYNPEDSSEHHTRRRENLKSHSDFSLLCSILHVDVCIHRVRSYLQQLVTTRIKSTSYTTQSEAYPQTGFEAHTTRKSCLKPFKLNNPRQPFQFRNISFPFPDKGCISRILFIFSTLP
jgi:hypothetical protein